MENTLAHHGIKGQKWGVRRFQNKDGTLTELGRKRLAKEASQDAKEYARAKMYYGKGAGNRRKLIKASVEQKMKDKNYKDAFDKALADQDMAKRASEARVKRKVEDTKDSKAKTARGLVNAATGNIGRASAASAAIFTAAHITGLSTLDKLKRALNLDGAAKSFSQVDSAAKKLDLSGISSAAETLKTRFSALEVMAVTSLANITNSAVNAGKQIVHSLTIAPIKQGFDEYELKMGSIQTMMMSTGESLESVNHYLDELNTYADKTIYSFSDMTSNIGKFTNAGVGLKDSVKAIQGVSNVAAISGANANEASRAMYNFAQALSAGSVKLIDWKSIENANMATVEFKNELIKTAVAMGTLIESEGRYISTTTDANGHVSDAFTATSLFNDSLSSQWMTTEVLVETLKRADGSLEI